MLNASTVARSSVWQVLCVAIAAIALLAGAIETAEARGRGGVQRMAIRPGSYHIPAGGGGGGGGTGTIVPAFCLDREADSPGPKDVFSSLGGDKDSVRVRIGNESLSLAEAIQRRLLRVRGSSIAEYLNSSYGKKKVPEGELNPLLLALMAQGNSHQSLMIENLDPLERPMRLEVGQAAFMGAGADSHPHLNSSDVARALDAAQRSQGRIDEQHAVWALETLRKLGYGSAGEDAAQFRSSVLQFQREYRIGATGALDTATLEELNRQTKLADGLSRANDASEGRYRVIHVERRTPVSGVQGNGFYRVQDGSSKPEFVNDAAGIIDIANASGFSTTANTVYVVLGGASTVQQRRALEISLETMRHGVSTRLVVPDDSQVARLLSPVRGKIEVSAQGSPELGPAGFYSQKVSLGAHQPTLTVHAKQPSLLKRFLAILSSLFSNLGFGASTSYAAVIQEARLRMAHDLGKTLSDVDEEIRINVGSTQVAEGEPADEQLASLVMTTAASW